MSERIALSHEDQDKLSKAGCEFERSSATRDEILTKCGNDLEKLKTLGVSAGLLASLRAEVNPPVLNTETPPAPAGDKGGDQKIEPAKTVTVPKEGSEVLIGELPVAPVTTFNIIRLMQLGYIPVDKPGTWKSPKWVFYGPNTLNLAGRAKTDAKMMDWAEVRSGVSFRTALEQDIAKVETELKKYKDATAAHFEIKTSLEKQLELLEKIRTERDPKVLQGHLDEYVKVSSNLRLAPGAVGYADPAARKTQAQLDAEIARAESKITSREDRIRADEQDLRALTTKGVKDSTGVVRTTKEEIEERNRKRIETLTNGSDQRIATIEKDLASKQAEVTKFQGEFDSAKGNISRLQGELNTISIQFTGRTVVDINADLTTERAKPKPNDKTIKDLQSELRVINDGTRIKGDLATLRSLDSRGNPVAPAVGTISVVYDAHTDLENAKNSVKTLEGDLAQAKKNKTKLLKDAEKRGQDDLNAHKKTVELKEKHITQGKEVLTKRQESETHVTSLNNEIKRIQTELAVAGISPAKQAQLEGELRALYGQKNAATTALEAAISSGSKNTKNGALDTEKAQIENEVNKLHQIDAELKPYKAQIDAIHAEVKAAQDALRNERDPVKAKKLLDEMPGKVNGWNQQIGSTNETARNILTRSGLNWKNIPDLELRAVLSGNPLLSNMIAHPEGFLAKVTAMEQTASGQKVMKFAYGGLRLVAVAGAARTIANDLTNDKLGVKAAVWDTVDAGMGFVGMVPVVGNIASGVWDIGWAAKQLVTGTDLNNREVGKTQSLVRMGFGVVGMIPVVGNIVKGTKAVAHSAQAVRAIDATTSAANLTMKGAAVAQVGTLAYDVIDVTANLVRNPVDTAMKVIRGQEQNGIFFPKK